METTAQAVIKEIASSLHSTVLKPRGFKKNAFTWIRHDEWPKLINLQLSQRNTSAEARFTLNLGVYIPELHNASGSYPVTGDPKEPDCDVRSRIGMLLPQGTDKWWDVSTATDCGSLFDEVSANLVEVGLPWLDGLRDYATAAAALMGQKNPFMAAIALKLDGREDEAAKAMMAAHAKANKLALPKLKRIAEAQGIPIKG